MREAYDCTPESLARAARVFRDAADLYQRVGDRRLLSDTLARLGYTTLHIAGHPREGAEAMSDCGTIRKNHSSITSGMERNRFT